MATPNKIDLAGVEADLKSFLAELPKYRESIEDPNVVLPIADESINLARSSLDGREAGSLNLREKLSMAMIKQHLNKLEEKRNEIRRGILKNAIPVPAPSSMETPDEIHAPLPLPVVPPSSANTTNASGGIVAKNRYDHKWNTKFEELRAFKEVHGHCEVPQRYKHNKSLGKWIGYQRNLYDKKEKRLTKERINALESIGFRWRLAAPRFVPPRVSWEDRFKELKRYKAQHGDCNVPKRYPLDPSLGMWVDRQRVQYRFYVKGEQSGMTRSRALALKEIGFQWTIRSPRK